MPLRVSDTSVHIGDGQGLADHCPSDDLRAPTDLLGYVGSVIAVSCKVGMSFRRNKDQYHHRKMGSKFHGTLDLLTG